MNSNNCEGLEFIAVEPSGIVVDAATLQTPQGKVFIRRRIPYDYLSKFSLADGLGIFFRYDKQRQFETLLNITKLPFSAVNIAHTEDKVIVGYTTSHPIDESERWASLNQEGNPFKVLEFGAVEVSRNWRGLGIAKQLLTFSFRDDAYFADKILISTELAWHWDYDQLGLSKFQYREFLKNTIEYGGFEQMYTDEPNVMMDAANMFMVRFGEKVDGDLLQSFMAMLFKNNQWGL
jgi:ribosomal protein S18 acetylase RimI-like enzyme